MPMPTRVQVGPFSYDVQHGKRHMKGTNASISYEKAEIRIEPGRAAQIDRESLLHEILHAVIGVSGHHFRYAENIDVHESIVHAIAPGLLDTLRRNPDFVAYLLEGDA